ncbi:MAG: hypothetical protein FJW35_03955 [Acidobacteria bacterium]|nr:hypothetical protein [Acidobacteriota bacterium]
MALRSRLGRRKGAQPLRQTGKHVFREGRDDTEFHSDGRPTARLGGILVTGGKEDIAPDEQGLATIKGLGARVAEVALRLRRAAV